MSEWPFKRFSVSDDPISPMAIYYRFITDFQNGSDTPPDFLSGKGMGANLSDVAGKGLGGPDLGLGPCAPLTRPDAAMWEFAKESHPHTVPIPRSIPPGAWIVSIAGPGSRPTMRLRCDMANRPRRILG